MLRTRKAGILKRMVKQDLFSNGLSLSLSSLSPLSLSLSLPLSLLSEEW